MTLFSNAIIKIILTVFIISYLCNDSLGQKLSPFEQYQKDSKMKNEVKLNLAYAPFGYFEGSYERLLTDKSSVGIVLGKSIETDINLDYHIIGFYRLFFGQMKCAGFFIEANTAYWKEDQGFFGNSTHHGIGAALGGKFFQGRKFHAEFMFGIGRTFTDGSEFDGAYPRYAISLGRRF